MAFDVLIEASAPGARIETDGDYVGTTPVHVKIFGDPDGTFHDFGSYQYVIRALPVATNQFAQVRAFGTGRGFTREDRIPQHLYFDMNQQTPVYESVAPHWSVYPDYWPPVFYNGLPYFGPEFRFYFGPHGHRRR